MEMTTAMNQVAIKKDHLLFLSLLLLTCTFEGSCVIKEMQQEGRCEVPMEQEEKIIYNSCRRAGCVYLSFDLGCGLQVSSGPFSHSLQIKTNVE